jgi:hypothetical protein
MGASDRPTCATDAGWGDRRLGNEPGSLTTDGCMCVRQQAGHVQVAGGRMAFSREDATPGWGRHSFVVPLAVAPGFCSSPVERLVETQRAAGPIPAGAIVPTCRCGGMHTRDAQNVVGPGL